MLNKGTLQTFALDLASNNNFTTGRIRDLLDEVKKNEQLQHFYFGVQSQQPKQSLLYEEIAWFIR